MRTINELTILIRREIASLKLEPESEARDEGVTLMEDEIEMLTECSEGEQAHQMIASYYDEADA